MFRRQSPKERRAIDFGPFNPASFHFTSPFHLWPPPWKPVSVADACHAAVDEYARELASSWGLVPPDTRHDHEPHRSKHPERGEFTKQKWAPLWETLGVLSAPTLTVGAGEPFLFWHRRRRRNRPCDAVFYDRLRVVSIRLALDWPFLPCAFPFAPFGFLGTPLCYPVTRVVSYVTPPG